MIFKEKYCNLFNENIEKAVYAHCISADAEMGAGIAVDFNKHFHLSFLFLFIDDKMRNRYVDPEESDK